jgi:hypothetical protein
MSHWRASLLLLMLLLGAGRGWAQFDGPGSPGVSASLMRLFGTNLAFTAQVEYQLLGPDNKERIGAPMSLARLNNRIRVEVDMSRMRNREESDALAKLKPLGLDQVTSVIRPDLRATVVAFPKLRAFVKLPMPPEEADAFTKPGKMERTPIGPEKMEGRLCTKYRVVATDAQGRRHEATVWNASDLRDFPVCVATREGPDTVVMRFRQVQFVRPEAAQFEPPAGFTECADMPALMAGPGAKYLLSSSPKSKSTKPAPAKATTPAKTSAPSTTKKK